MLETNAKCKGPKKNPHTSPKSPTIGARVVPNSPEITIAVDVIFIFTSFDATATPINIDMVFLG